jgi:hypothetical protein
MKFISPKIHGIIDLLIVVFLLATPTVFNFTGYLIAFTYALACLQLLLVLLTNYPIGVLKVIPFFLHGSIEFIIGDVLIAFGYTLFKDNIIGKLFYILFGTVVLLTWLCTDYLGMYSKTTENA